jgi:copper(I)-binding protein
VNRSSLAAARPRRLLVLAIAALAVTSCEAGNNAPVNQWHPPAGGRYQMFGDIAISNAFVLGPAIGQTLPQGGSASAFLALNNTGSPDTLVSVSAPGTARSVTLTRGSVRLASQQSVLLTGPTPDVILNDLTQPLAGGSTVELVLDFRNAGSTSIRVPVMPHALDYSTLQPPPSPTPRPTASPRATASPGATVSPGATPSPTATSSPSPTATP